MSKNKAEVEKYRVQLDPIPRIVGADFDFSNSDIEYYKHKIDELPKEKEKRRILFCGEATYLNTGFSTYWREVAKRLYKTGRFEIGEFGSYGAARELDERAAEIPWKYYHNMPSNPIEEMEYGTRDGKPIAERYHLNQFGQWRFNYVCADFKPDFVLCLRDNWMDSYIKDMPYRNNFTWGWMACIDSYPQKWPWMKTYSNVDHLFAYSYYGKKVLEEQSKTRLAKVHGISDLKVLEVCSPGIDTNIYKPVNKKEVRKMFNLPEGVKIIGTVMRNQPRKLYPRLFESFRMFKQRYPRESHNVFLLLHTSIPDMGWDIPEHISRNNIEEFCIFTYVCENCGSFGIRRWGGPVIDCPKCKKHSLRTPTTQVGIPDEQFSLIYNAMDVYVQTSICEGFGMPILNAKACGVPCLVADYSAMYEQARNGGAMPIDIETLYTEGGNDGGNKGTEQWRSLFSRKDLAQKMAVLFRNSHKREKLSREARECAMQHYSWDLAAIKWQYHLLSLPKKDRNKTWDAKIELKTPSKVRAPRDIDDVKFIEWLYRNILGRKGVDAGGMAHWRGALANGMSRGQLENHFQSIVREENRYKKGLINPKTLLPNPVDRVSEIIRETEDDIQ